MTSFNKVILMGNLTRDPEVRFTPSGTPLSRAYSQTSAKMRSHRRTDVSSGSGAWRRSFSSQRGNAIPSHCMKAMVFSDPHGDNVTTIGIASPPRCRVASA